MEFDSYSVILLRRGARADALPSAELDALQAAHESYLARMGQAGKLVGAGPFTDQVDDSFRGISFYACPLAEAVELTERDPAVIAGRLAYDAMTWLTPRGTVVFHPQHLPQP
jgi:uncharacterized protein YciI